MSILAYRHKHSQGTSVARSLFAFRDTTTAANLKRLNLVFTGANRDSDGLTANLFEEVRVEPLIRGDISEGDDAVLARRQVMEHERAISCRPS